MLLASLHRSSALVYTLGMKQCSKCEQSKDYSDFHKNKANADGYQSQCKDCRHETRVAKWDTTPQQPVVRVRSGKVQVYTRGKNHGESRTPLYRRWKSMRERCSNPQHQNYKYYGGKGIRVCDEWNKDFFAFKKWAASSGYSPELELDRIDPAKDYSPENCRWLGKRENIKRARSALNLETAILLGEKADELGVSQDTIIVSIVEEYFSARLAANALGGDA